MTFNLHPQLERDCITVGRLTLCRLLLMNDKQFPWFILVPEIEGITEIFQLDRQQRGLLIEESSFLAEQLNTLYKADKINIAAIGNLVPQLHVHHVVRYRSDKAWPAPVWGKFAAIPYSEQELADTATIMTGALDLND
ncbi:HIT family protein [Methyloglobulus sp.]|uniref:HIT family protein n=1 Tax=Methyloglobulus sp. TaxID=2518622 RepID=UPI0032B705ED